MRTRDNVPSFKVYTNVSDSQWNEPINLNIATKNLAQGFCLAKDSGTPIL